MSWFFPKRATESFADSLAASGAWSSGEDPIDGDVGFRKMGAGRREVPIWTLQKARSYAVHAYRTNPMAKAIIDTYTSFCVGDSGLTLHCTNADVRKVAEAFWKDTRNALADYRRQELLLRSHMLMGETALELMVGASTGVTRFSYIDPEIIVRVELDRGNPLWPARLVTRDGAVGDEVSLDVARIDDISGLRTGEVLFEKSWTALASDRRGYPFLSPILDWLGAYDEVLWNLIDRTALARYLVWDVEVQGDQSKIDEFIKARGGKHAPKSGSMEIHNPGVKFEAKTADVGAHEDKATAAQLLTNVAAGSGLAKTWLAEPEDANRATSLTMAEPVRRRVGGVQGIWLSVVTELVRFAVDQAVAADRVESLVTVKGEEGDERQVPASETVTVTGPEIAASDAKVSAEILVNLSQALVAMQIEGLLSPKAAQMAAKKAWEDYVGIPYNPELDGDSDAIADQIDKVDAETEAERGRRGALGLLAG